MSLQLFVRNTSDVTIIDLHGRVTIGRANDLLENKLRQLIDEGSSKIVLNLTDISQMDSSSISSVVRAFKSLRLRGGSLKLLRPRGNVKLVLEAVHLLDVVPAMDDETQAIASFQ